MDYDQADQENGQVYALVWAKRSEIGMVRAIARKLGSEKMVELDPELPAFRLYETKIPQASKDKVAHEFRKFITPEAMQAATSEKAERDEKQAATKRVIDLSSKAVEDREVYYVPKTLQAEFDRERRTNRIITEFDRERKVFVGVKGPEGKMERWRTPDMKTEWEQEAAIINIKQDQNAARRGLFGQNVSRARMVQDGLSLAAEFPEGLRVPQGDSELDQARRSRATELLSKVNYEADLQTVVRANKEQEQLAHIRLVRAAASGMGVGVEDAARSIKDILHLHESGQKKLPIDNELKDLQELRAGSDMLWTRLRELGYGSRREKGSEQSDLESSTTTALKNARAAKESQAELGVPLSEAGQAKVKNGEPVLAVEQKKATAPTRGRSMRAPEPEKDVAGAGAEM